MHIYQSGMEQPRREAPPSELETSECDFCRDSVEKEIDWSVLADRPTHVAVRKGKDRGDVQQEGLVDGELAVAVEEMPAELPPVEVGPSWVALEL